MVDAASTFELPDGRTVEVVRNYVEYETMGGPVRDEAWVGVDSNGHEHRGDNLDATLRGVIEPSYVVDEGDGYVEEYPGDSWWECRTCGERVVPGTRMDPGGVRRMLASEAMYVDGEPVTSAADADAIMAEVAAARG